MRQTSAHGGDGGAEFHDWYRVLDVPETATAADVRRGYHKSILRCHPDKVLQQNREVGGRKATAAAAAGATEEASLVLRAWETLRDPDGRRYYDALLRENKLKQHGPVVHSEVDLDDMDYDATRSTFSHSCCCSGRYFVAEADLERASDLGAVVVGCDRCSLRINVLFAVNEEG